MKDNNNTNNFWQKIKNNFNEYKPAWIAVLVVLVLAVVAAAAPWEKGNNNTAQDNVDKSGGCEPGFKFNVYTGEPCEEKDAAETKTEDAPQVSQPEAPAESAGEVAAPAPKKYPSLAEALKIYEGNSFAVVAGCNINPASQEVAKDTKIMVHNATGTQHAVLVAGQTLTLKPYYYRTVTLGTPGEVSLRCDGKTAGKIIVK